MGECVSGAVSVRDEYAQSCSPLLAAQELTAAHLVFHALDFFQKRIAHLALTMTAPCCRLEKKQRTKLS